MQQVERVQTGIRIEKRLMKVMKALAERLDMPLGELVEGVMLHAMEGRSPFGEPTLREIELLRQVYGLSLTANDSHRLVEGGDKQ
jgi:hypothetical protein